MSMNFTCPFFSLLKDCVTVFVVWEINTGEHMKFPKTSVPQNVFFYDFGSLAVLRTLTRKLIKFIFRIYYGWNEAKKGPHFPNYQN